MRTVLFVLVTCLLASTMASDVVDLGERDSASGRFKKFDRVVGGSKPTLVFFYLPGCGHCRGFQPEFREAADHFSKDDVIFARVNAERWDELSKEYNVERVPDIRFCPAGARGAACQRYPEYSANTASGVIDFLSGKIASRFLQQSAEQKADVDTETAAAIAATKGTCPVVYHDKDSDEMTFSQVHTETDAETEVDAEAEEEAVEAELDEEEAELETDEESEEEAEDEEAEEEVTEDEEAEEVDEESEAEAEVEEEADEAIDEESETEDEAEEEVDEEADEEVDEEADEEAAIDEEATDEEAADAHAESEEEMTSFLEIAHSQIDEAMAAFREENGN
jgi:thiol-disulfide isomerase/thioredoxin